MSVAQNFDLGSWNILNLKYNVNDKWSVFGEAQLRSLKFYTNFHYYEYKRIISIVTRKVKLNKEYSFKAYWIRNSGNNPLP